MRFIKNSMVTLLVYISAEIQPVMHDVQYTGHVIIQMSPSRKWISGNFNYYIHSAYFFYLQSCPAIEAFTRASWGGECFCLPFRPFWFWVLKNAIPMTGQWVAEYGMMHKRPLCGLICTTKPWRTQEKSLWTAVHWWPLCVKGLSWCRWLWWSPVPYLSLFSAVAPQPGTRSSTWYHLAAAVGRCKYLQQFCWINHVGSKSVTFAKLDITLCLSCMCDLGDHRHIEEHYCSHLHQKPLSRAGSSQGRLCFFAFFLFCFLKAAPEGSDSLFMMTDI